MSKLEQRSGTGGFPLVDSWIDVHAHFRPPASEAENAATLHSMREACWCVNEAPAWDLDDVLAYKVRRFYCSNPCCCRRTFAEPESDLVARWARRTRRLAETQGRVGIICGGAPGARLLTHLRMPASRATVLRLVRAMPMPDAPTPIHVGVDDWAIRKGCSYGTIVVADTFSARLPHGPGPSLLDPYVDYLLRDRRGLRERHGALARDPGARLPRHQPADAPLRRRSADSTNGKAVARRGGVTRACRAGWSASWPDGCADRPRRPSTAWSFASRSRRPSSRRVAANVTVSGKSMSC